MKRKYFAILVAAAGILPASAWDNLYLIGPGTPTGWSLDDAIEMNSIGDNKWATVCYLDNDGGVSFRVQSNKEWDNNYFGPSEAGMSIDNDETKAMVNTENCFSVAVPGVYYIEADMIENNVKINRMSDIYAIGTVKDHVWELGNHSPLNNAADQNLYTGIVTFDQGEFKFAVDPGNGKWNNGFFLMKDDKGHFKTSATESKWTVGYPLITTDESGNKTVSESDLDPGTYRITVNAVFKDISYTRLPESVSLDGGAVGLAWDMSNRLALTKDENNEFVGSHVFIKPGDVFKPVVDGKYYGSQSWTNFTFDNLSENGSDTEYLRNSDVGADLAVNVAGFREVKMFPSPAGDGTLGIYVGAPQDVYYEGIGVLDYNQATNAYENNSYCWRGEGWETKVMVGGDNVATLTPETAGWYTCRIGFNGAEAEYQLVKQPVTLTVGNETITLGDGDASSQCYIKNAVYVKAGDRVSATVGNSQSGSLSVGSTGLYNIKIERNDNGETMVDCVGPISVHMPLKESDFANGRKHYFIVGQRMGAWRLQPEWELTDAGNGTYQLPDRLLYNGYIMIGVVDNYADYIAQTYKAFTVPGAVLDPGKHGDEKIYDEPKDIQFELVGVVSSGKNGCADGKFTSTRYNDIQRTSPVVQHGCDWSILNTKMINVLSADGGGTQADLQSSPSRAKTIVLSVDANGNPHRLTFKNVSTKPSYVAEIRTFSLVGSGIKNHDISYDELATTPLNHQSSGYHGEEWADAWIQYDSSRQPYVDAYGEYIYQTSFTTNWLAQHPSYFNFIRESDGNVLEYTSNNITFTYYPDESHVDQFGQRTFIDEEYDNNSDYEKKEVLITYSNDHPDDVHGQNAHPANGSNFNDVLTIPGDRRRCYAVNDMWMKGEFKVWSGWGGSTTNYEYEENGTDHTRWYRDNAGHGAWRENRVAFYRASTDMAFTLFEDMDAANFAIGYGDLDSEKVNADGSIKEGAGAERRFFKRVEIWYDLDNNFVYTGERASILVFVLEQGGPQIQIAHHSDNSKLLTYSFAISLPNGGEEGVDERNYGNVTYYKIERIPINEDGSEGTPVVVEENDNLSLHRTELGTNDGVENYYFTDPEELEPGRYRYQITTKREKTGDAIKTAKSNILAVVASSSDESTGIESVYGDETEEFDMNIAVSDTGRINVMANGDLNRVDVYSVNGSLMRSAVVSGCEANIDGSSLPTGIYIVRANGVAKRIIKR